MEVYHLNIEDFNWSPETKVLSYRVPSDIDFVGKVPLPTISVQGVKHRIAFSVENENTIERYLVYGLKFKDLWAKDGFDIDIKLHIYY